MVSSEVSGGDQPPDRANTHRCATRSDHCGELVPRLDLSRRSSKQSGTAARSGKFAESCSICLETGAVTRQLDSRLDCPAGLEERLSDRRQKRTRSSYRMRPSLLFAARDGLRGWSVWCLSPPCLHNRRAPMPTGRIALYLMNAQLGRGRPFWEKFYRYTRARRFDS